MTSLQCCDMNDIVTGVVTQRHCEGRTMRYVTVLLRKDIAKAEQCVTLLCCYAKTLRRQNNALRYCVAIQFVYPLQNVYN